MLSKVWILSLPILLLLRGHSSRAVAHAADAAYVEIPTDEEAALAQDPSFAEAFHADQSLLRKKKKKTKIPNLAFGGLVFFLHIPKTGGTSIRLNFENLDRVNYVFGRNYSVYWDTAPVVEDAILHGTKNSSILFYEIHAADAPSFFRLRNRLKRWKDTAARNYVPTFFFTVLRDPLAFSFSHFNFFHVQQRNPTFERCNATEEDFLRLSLQNPQCQFLFKGEPSLRAQKPKQIAVSPEQCQNVHENMLDLMDWIGTTDNLSNETLPLLAKLFASSQDSPFQKHRVTKQAGETFGRENVTSSTISTILRWSTLDTQIYESAKRKYPYSMWDL